MHQPIGWLVFEQHHNPMSRNIYTIAVLKAKPGRLDDLKVTLETLAAETRKESGAQEYFFIQDESHDNNTILSYERWEKAEEESKHWETPHLNHALGQLGDILDGDAVIHKGFKVI